MDKESISSSVKQAFSTIDEAIAFVSKREYLKQAKEEYSKKAFNNTTQRLTRGPQNVMSEEIFEPIYDQATSGLEKIAGGKEGTLTDEEKFATEAIIVLEGRPPILIEKNKFVTQPAGSKWHVLENHRQNIENCILSVGRINLKGNPSFAWVGTGFLVAPDVLMTNAHVANEFSKKQGDVWTFKPGQTGSIDYGQDASLTNHNEFEINGIIGLHDSYDLALLRVSNINGNNKFPEPLKIASSLDEANIKNKNVYVIGFPARDDRRNDPIEMERIFDSIYNVKRLQPGTIIGMDRDDPKIMYHDASTLGGNSGSCVIDLERNEVIGLHFGGTYLSRNYGVALWKLVNDPLLQKAGVNFQ
jgi:V8-like Glu-specific endopeptidase